MLSLGFFCFYVFYFEFCKCEVEKGCNSLVMGKVLSDVFKSDFYLGLRI